MGETVLPEEYVRGGTDERRVRTRTERAQIKSLVARARHIVEVDMLTRMRCA